MCGTGPSAAKEGPEAVLFHGPFPPMTAPHGPPSAGRGRRGGGPLPEGTGLVPVGGGPRGCPFVWQRGPLGGGGGGLWCVVPQDPEFEVQDAIFANLTVILQTFNAGLSEDKVCGLCEGGGEGGGEEAGTRRATCPRPTRRGLWGG